MTMHDAVDLTDQEARCLALRIAARQIGDCQDWLEWEDYPMLGEFAFERLVAAMDTVADDLRRQTRQGDRMYDVDSAHLMERATA